MKDRLYANFEMHFSVTASKAERYYESGDDELTIVLQNGDRVLYDDVDKTIRSLPRDSDHLSELECRTEFAKRLRKVMYKKGITQIELSEMTGITQQTISLYMSGKRLPGFYNVDKIAKALGCSIEELRYT